MYKEYLVSPGPTQVPQDALLAMASPIYHHRTSRFSSLFAEASEKLKSIFQTSEDVYTLTSSGTGAMEAAMVNTINEGDSIITINAGKFGERWTKLGKMYGACVDEIVVDWGKSINPTVVEEKLKANPKIKAVFVQYSETSTGALHDVKALGEVVSKTDAILVVDAITALGVHECKTDEWGLDIVITGSQKAMMLPPGLAMLSVSKKAWKLVEESKTPKFYFDLKAARKSLAKKTTAYTPAVTLIIGLNEILNRMLEEGIDNIVKRHENIAEATREGVKALGLKIFPDNPSNGVSAVLAPEGTNGKAIKSTMENKYKISIAGSQDVDLADIFRIGHIGYYDKSDIIITLSSLEFTLKDLGINITLGSSLAAAQSILYKGAPNE